MSYILKGCKLTATLECLNFTVSEILLVINKIKVCMNAQDSNVLVCN